MMANKKNSTIDTVYEAIKEKIIEMAYEPNEHLIEEVLSTEFEVSRTPLRQALYRLELEGLVYKKTTGRIHVAALSSKEAEEIFYVREILEGLIARLATIHIAADASKEEILHQLQDIMLLMRNAAESGRQADVVRYGNEFHNILETHSENQTAVHMLRQIKSRLARYRRVGVYKDPDYPATKPVDEHEEILQLVVAGDAEGAEVAMRAHIMRSLQNTIQALSYLRG